MYVILVYDIKESRVNTINKFLKRYLFWIQNSVFEGEITDGQYEILINKIKEMIDENEDSVIIYKIRSEKIISKEIIGLEKSPTDNII
ncbi:MAG: CRISPR-associated endonuclease Cas2 [Thermoplasmata archaeon]